MFIKKKNSNWDSNEIIFTIADISELHMNFVCANTE